MTTIAELILKADYRQVDQAEGSLDRLTSTGEKAVGTMTKLAATLGIAFRHREVVRAADAYNGISNRLEAGDQLDRATDAGTGTTLQDQSETRQPIEATAEVYQRLAQNARRSYRAPNDVSKDHRRPSTIIPVALVGSQHGSGKRSDGAVRAGLFLRCAARRRTQLRDRADPALARGDCGSGMASPSASFGRWSGRQDHRRGDHQRCAGTNGDAVNDSSERAHHRSRYDDGGKQLHANDIREGWIRRAGLPRRRWPCASGGISSFIDGPVLESATAVRHLGRDIQR